MSRIVLTTLAAASLAAAAASAEDRTLSFRTSNGNTYLTAPGGGGSDLFADKYAAREWESFRVIDINGGQLRNWDPVCLRTWNGHFVVAEMGGGRETKANRDACGRWETFRLVRLGGPGGFPIADGEPFPSGRFSFHVGLQASDGSWVVAENGGGGAVNANRPAFGRWERFEAFPGR